MTKKRLIIIIAAVIVVLGAAAAFFFIRQNASTKPVATLQYSPGDAFVTNIYGTESLIKINIMLDIREDDQEQIALTNNLIRDTVLRVMRSQEEALYKQSDTLDQMSRILRDALNAALAPHFAAVERPEYEITEDGREITGAGPVLDVLFVEFVMQ